MLTLKEAIKILEHNLPEGQTVYPSYGEIQEKYVFNGQFSDGCIPPGGFNWTVHKETGECKCETLERENWTPTSRFPFSFYPIKGYKKIELTDD